MKINAKTKTGKDLIVIVTDGAIVWVEMASHNINGKPDRSYMSEVLPYQISGPVECGDRYISSSAGNILLDKVSADLIQAQINDYRDNRISIFLSGRGWGDYSNLQWTGDIRRPDSDILAECKYLLKAGNDVDQPDQTDDEILLAIRDARVKHAQPKYDKLTESHGQGYCYHCETYCYGDCGDYAPTITRKAMAQELNEVAAEENYGIAEGA